MASATRVMPLKPARDQDCILGRFRADQPDSALAKGRRLVPMPACDGVGQIDEESAMRHPGVAVTPACDDIEVALPVVGLDTLPERHRMRGRSVEALVYRGHPRRH